MTDDIAPTRDFAPNTTPIPQDFAPSGRDPAAPYGYKKDGTPAKQRGRPAGYKLGSRTSKGSLRDQIGGFLITINTPLMLIPGLQKDALDSVEINALAKSIDEECQRSPRFRKYVEQALVVQGTTSLLAVIGIIGARRAIRHDIVPIPADGPIKKDEADALLGGALSMMTGTGAFNPNVTVPQQPVQTEAF